MAVSVASRSDEPLPYSPAGISRFLSWVDSLPWHGWWVFPALALLELTWSHAVLWGTGRLRVGVFDPVVGFGAAYGPYTLAVLTYLNSVARGALRSFWPATGWPESERSSWSFSLTTMPAGHGAITLLVGALLTVGAFLAAPSGLVIGDSAGRVIQFVAYAPTLFLGYVLFVVAIDHNLRQLRLVSTIHRRATVIDPFDRVPVYAFSRLTVQTGLAYILVGYYALTVNGSWQANNVISVLVLTGVFAVGIAAFVVPLWGIHGRLVHEKEMLLRGADQRLDRLATEMYERVDAGRFDSTKAIGESIAAVGATRQRIEHLPTWPWPPQVLRGFVSALLLPIVVYVISRFISSNFGA